MPLNKRERAVAMPEQTQHRHHAVDGVEELGGGCSPRAA